MGDAYASMRRKVKRLLTGGRRLLVLQELEGALGAIAETHERALGPERADALAFNLLDWADDAAFLVALCLHPTRFTRTEVEAGVAAFLVHAPAHVIAAARLSGHSTDDIFLALEPPTRPSSRRKPRRRRTRT
jgi:SpoU rRNA methylase family enzyme